MTVPPHPHPPWHWDVEELPGLGCSHTCRGGAKRETVTIEGRPVGSLTPNL